MNQILLTNSQDIKKKSGNKYNKNNSGDIKKIIIFFSIAILIFAIAIIVLYVFKMSKREEKIPVEKPKLSLEQVDNKVKIIVEAEAGIEELEYKWNEGETVNVEMNGRTIHEEALEIPEGRNTLKIAVKDTTGEEIKTEKEFYIEETSNPVIELSEMEDGKLVVKATDENGIKSISYAWNEDEEVIIEAQAENQTELEIIIDIKRGENKVVITAVNNSDKTEVIEKIYKGVKNPKIDVTREGNVIYMKMVHDMGFKKITFTVNGQEYVYDENYSGYNSQQTEISYKFDLQEGENTVIIHAISLENTEKTYRGKSTYTQ